MGSNADKFGLEKQDDHDGMEANNQYVSILLTGTIVLL